MPTDLPPDYKPQPAADPNNPADPTVPGSAPAYPPVRGDDVVDDPTGGALQPGADVLDPPPGWSVPPLVPGADPDGVPQPAGMPAF